jgi:hypothetical protein
MRIDQVTGGRFAVHCEWHDRPYVEDSGSWVFQTLAMALRFAEEAEARIGGPSAT